jgi:hypothetical protein
VTGPRLPERPGLSFLRADAFDLRSIPGTFDAAFAGFWWSHLRRSDVSRFLGDLHDHLQGRGARAMLVDNRYVEGSNWPIARTDSDGNSYQHRRLDDGREHEVLKNFPSPSEVQDAVASPAGQRSR